MPHQNWDLKMYNSQKRSVCIDAYGGKCVCCGETRDSFLQIDHINDDGYLHKKSAELKRMGFFKWLITHDFPKGFQILCANCNHSKRVLHGICEHELDKPLDIEGLIIPDEEESTSTQRGIDGRIAMLVKLAHLAG